MKTVTINYPIIGWGSTTIQVEDDMEADEILDLIYDDTIEVEFNQYHVEQVFPVFSLADWRDEIRNSEVPDRIEVAD